ncbi:hypothetical protein EV421DRAFT_1909401 [Armillaria borealis]|uniref:Uncharacterized protein n=1 Tax=Armillaria borealis TaxID=47425 RepID=A0AA39J1Q1_9AGAR|nr:hypothetical protein EV421DRAFT_1909401 [Armillaria borealis]
MSPDTLRRTNHPFTDFRAVKIHPRVYSSRASMNGFLWSVVPTLTVLEYFKMVSAGDTTCHVLSVMPGLYFFFTFCWGRDSRYRERRIRLRSGLSLPALVGSIGQAYRETRANAGFGFVVYNNDDCCLRARKRVVMSSSFRGRILGGLPMVVPDGRLSVRHPRPPLRDVCLRAFRI